MSFHQISAQVHMRDEQSHLTGPLGAQRFAPGPSQIGYIVLDLIMDCSSMNQASKAVIAFWITRSIPARVLGGIV
jgi:hypothetical protein